jgi:Arc/MetJ-type ribon-helix-helix transcriptional regulator
MPILTISEDLQLVIDKAVEEDEYADAVEYITRLVRQDQKRRAKEQIFATLAQEPTEEEPNSEAAKLAEALQQYRTGRHDHSHHD